MLELGTDELTLILQITEDYKINIHDNNGEFMWRIAAKNMIREFEKKSNIDNIFGERTPLLKSKPQGYDTAYTYGEHNFYFAIAYHKLMMSMGICVKFSAKSLNYYLEQSHLQVYDLIQNVQSDFYTTRLSRIDFVADYIDEDVDVTEIYNQYMKNKIAIFKEEFSIPKNELVYIKQNKKYKGILRGKEVGTMYLGSRRSNSMLRIYDKKTEQIENNGIHLEKAIRIKNWVRFEVEFRGKYSHQITTELLKIKNSKQYADLISSTILQKYRFMHVNKKNSKADYPTYFTEILIDSIENQNFCLSAPSTRNYELIKSVGYLLHESG